MLQLGGDQWEKFYPVMAKEMISGQLQDGSWRGFINAQGNEGRWGSSFTTSTAVLALAVPDQLIPVFQR